GERHHRVHVPGGRNRTGEMRHDADFVGIAHRHDLEHLRNAANVWQRCAGEIDIALLNERTELRPCPPFLAWCQRHHRQQPQLRYLRSELFLANRVLDDERPRRFHETADLHGFVKIELLVEVDHPVAVRADSFADLLDRLDDEPNVRPRIEDRPAAGAAASATTGRRTGHVAASSRAASAWENATVDAVDTIPGRHRR